MIKNSSIILNSQSYEECNSHKYGSAEAKPQVALITFGDSITGKSYRDTTATAKPYRLWE
jgi:hypothetical protein